MDSAHSKHGKCENVYNILVGQFERKKPHGQPVRRWEVNDDDDADGVRLRL
jgi:hypothetical protein